ncbi:beta-1,3-galactosyltransferase 1-like [Argopecten irradians]|uniref:beta-1,3-galactosyltransferase 1-like n=1 Tax=Argopecten irradians TaxID=31199 RepID=UPI00370F9A26
MRIVRYYTMKLFLNRSNRTIALLVLTNLVYLAFHVQHDIRFIMRKRDQDANTSLPVLTTTEIPFVDNSTEEAIVIPDIHFPMDIDLEKAVREKLDSGKSIPHRPINSVNYRYLYRPHVCVFNSTEPFNLLILVKSSIRNVFLRNTIRDTWASDLGDNVKIAFMLGYSPLFKDMVAMEAKAYNDIIMQNFIDAYSNNTLKSIMGFYWAVNDCPTAHAILFIDDDHLPHMRNIMSYLHSLSPNQLDDVYSGYRINKGVVCRGRDKWAIPRKVYPHKYWPPYLRGGAYLISNKNALKFSVAFPYVRLLHVDDSYLGLVSLKLHILPQHDVRFMMDRSQIATQKHYFAFFDYKMPRDLRAGWKTITS